MYIRVIDVLPLPFGFYTKEHENVYMYHEPIFPPFFFPPPFVPYFLSVFLEIITDTNRINTNRTISTPSWNWLVAEVDHYTQIYG